MSKTRVDMIIETLRDNPERRFTAKELAIEFIRRYPNEMAEKQRNPRYDTAEKLLAQVTAEVGGSRTSVAKQRCPNVATQDRPRPRLYYWDKNPDLIHTNQADDIDESELEVDIPLAVQTQSLTEYDLYPLLIEFLSKDNGLHCLRIDEKTSSNSYGSGGNQWLHPDIVAMEALDMGWDPVVRECVRHGNDSSIRLWSFEVKKQLTRSNVRQCFFQTVSNSSWANYGYLVATGISNDVNAELQMLCSLHGIGVLLLDVDSLFDSQILIPACERPAIDWQSVNRIASENQDFHRFVEQVGIYSQTGRLLKSIWNK